MTDRTLDRQIDLSFGRAPPGGRPHPSREPHVARILDRIVVHEHEAHDMQRREARARETEARLRALEAQYRAALSHTVVAKSRYLAMLGDRASTPPAIDKAYRRWQLLKLQRLAFAGRMAAIERRERDPKPPARASLSNASS